MAYFSSLPLSHHFITSCDKHTFMDCSLSTPSLLSDQSDEPQTPLRSPSRLDFCMEDLQDDGSVLEAEDESEMHNNRPCTFIEQDALAVDVASPDRCCLLIVEGGEDDPPQATDSHSHENAETSHTAIPREQPMEVVIEHRSPIPVRPLLVRFDLDAREAMPPSRTAPERLNYPHHGLSRSALLQQKTLWNSRHEEWRSCMEQGDAQKQESNAYTGLDTARPHVVENPPPYMRTPPSGLERDLADRPPKKHGQDVHASIFPRVGDISALRDPYSANIDRCFFKFPLWTLHKMLYMFDVHQRSTSFAPSTSVCNLTHVKASMSSSTLSSYTSSVSGDDSPIPESQLPPECTLSPHSLSSWDRFCGWDLSWYARWELLLGHFQRDHTKCDTLEMSMKLAVPVESKTAPSSPPGRIFRFTFGEDEGDDDDEDYGMVVPDPTFSMDFDEECERAMAFYSRESKFSEMDL